MSGQECLTGHRAAGISLGPSGSWYVGTFTRSLLCASDTWHAWGRGNAPPACCLISTVSMWTKDYKLLNKGFSYGIFRIWHIFMWRRKAVEAAIFKGKFIGSPQDLKDGGLLLNHFGIT